MLPIAVIVLACAGAPEPPPVSTAPTRHVLYAEQVDRQGGTRVWSDGVFETRARPDDPWIKDGRLTADGLSAVMQALDDERLTALPATTPEAPEDDGPGITWTLRVADAMRNIRDDHYDGHRPAPIESVHVAVATGRPVVELKTVWTLHEGGIRRLVHVPCQPLQVPALGPILRPLLADDHPPVSDPPADPPLRLDVHWTEGELEWRTQLTTDGHAVRVMPDGHRVVTPLSPQTVAGIETAMAAAPWGAFPGLCK